VVGGEALEEEEEADQEEQEKDELAGSSHAAPEDPVFDPVVLRKHQRLGEGVIGHVPGQVDGD
jgi:hypothetical protein